MQYARQHHCRAEMKGRIVQSATGETAAAEGGAGNPPDFHTANHLMGRQPSAWILVQLSRSDYDYGHTAIGQTECQIGQQPTGRRFIRVEEPVYKYDPVRPYPAGSWRSHVCS